MGQCNNCTGNIKIPICKTSVDGHSSYALSEWNWFWNQLKNEQLETDSYKSQIKYYIIIARGTNGASPPAGPLTPVFANATENSEF